MTQRITCNPDPPVAGQPCEVCYEFAGSGLTETSLSYTWTPDATSPSSTTHKTGKPCVTITVPAGSTSVTIEDDGGASDSYVSMI